MQISKNIFDTPNKPKKVLYLYKRTKHLLDLPEFETLTDIEGHGIDMNKCRNVCFMGRSYSHSRYLSFLCGWFGVALKDVKELMK